jgi:hypothetical protein
MTTRTTPSTGVDERQTTLEAFARALRREAHVLAEWPELTWQQLHNRLQWADPPLADHLAAERERRSRPGADPWIHNHSRPRESEALIRTLTGHTGPVEACAVSPDGTWVVSASADGTVKIWDAATGTERATLTGHTGGVRACAVSPDGTWVVSASDDGTLKIWDAATGTERATLTGHTCPVEACAVSPDGTWVVSASDDGTVKIWDAATGTERTRLFLSGGATAVAFHPCAPMVICGDAGGGMSFADLVGISLGPFVVTAMVRNQELTLCCPACREVFEVERERLGTEATCPLPACGARLRINPFVPQPRIGS